MSRTRGFTLIEISAVIAVLGLFAALIMPNLLAQRASRTARSFVAALPRLASEAREIAIAERRVTSLRFDEAQGLLQVVVDAQQDENEDTLLREARMPEGFEMTTLRLEEEDVAPGEWIMRFYPDGRSDGGGIQVGDRGRPISLLIDREGNTRLLKGPLPAAEEAQWPAGEYEQRA